MEDTPPTVVFGQELKSKANPHYNLLEQQKQDIHMPHLPCLQEAAWPLDKKLLRNCSRAQASLRQHNADHKQDRQALACLVFLFCLYNSKINQLVLVILISYDKTYISSSNFLFHVCFSFFLFSSLFLLLRFLQDEIPGNSSSPGFKG